jgi:hypothetical protein
MTIVKQGELDEYVKLETKLLYKTHRKSGLSEYCDINEIMYEFEYVWKPDIGDIQSCWFNPEVETWTQYHLNSHYSHKLGEFDPENDIWD